MAGDHNFWRKTSPQGPYRAQAGISTNVDGRSPAVNPLHDLRRALTRMRTGALERKRALARLAVIAADDRVLALPEVAEILQLNPETVRLRMQRGEMRGAQLDHGVWCIRKIELIAYIESELATRADLSAADVLGQVHSRGRTA